MYSPLISKASSQKLKRSFNTSMAERRISLRVSLVFCLILGVLHSTQSNNLDERCIKRYSASYKQNATQLEISGEPTMYPASNAIDGESGTCSKTSVSKNDDPWWSVDLGKQVHVTAIRIKNSWKHPTTISIQVLVKDKSGFLCGSSHILEGGETRIIQCGLSIVGSLVKIVGIKEQEYLALCEVDVFDETVQITEGVNYKAWFGLTPEEYGSLKFLRKVPKSQGVFSTFQAARNISDYYGIQMTTYYSPPETGNYTFSMSGDNKSDLYIRDVSRGSRSTKIARIPRNDGAPSFTKFDRWDESASKPQALEKDEIYELVAIMREAVGEDHLRVGVVLPNGEFEGPMKHRIFTSESAARGRIRHECSRSEKTTTDVNVPSVGVSKTESAITEGIRQLQRGGLDNRTKLQMLDDLEQLGLVRARSLTLGNKTFASFISRVDNFVFAAVAFNLTTFRGFNFPGSLENASLFKDGSITFPDTIFGSTKGRASVVIMTFKPVKEMIKRTGSDENLLGSDVISAIIESQTTGNLTKPVRLVFRNTKDANNSERHCVFWVEDNKYSSDGKFGRWSKKGCSLVHKNDTHTTCQCNHLTKFALIFPVEEGSSKDEVKLELITYVGLSLSSAGCFITFAVYLFLRITRSLKTIVHLNLVLALGLADIVFLFGNLAENYKNVCFACTVLTFYLYLAVFAWMLLEGVHLYFLVIRVFGSDDTRRKKFYNLVGWGIPLIIVIITTGILRYELVDKKHCWLSSENGAVWAFIGPALFVITINTLILGAVLRTTMTVLRKDPGHRKEKSALRTVAMLVPILGITWVFGVVTFANDSIVFQYIFAACNAFQGFFIFILYCLFNTEVRHEYERKRKAWKTEREIESKRSKQNNSLDMLAQQPRSSL